MNFNSKSVTRLDQNSRCARSLHPPPFGMQIQERSYISSDKGYRYGFNGMEKDNEVKGDGNSLDFGSRIYDSRLGRWLSVDPMFKSYASLASYNYAANSPILFIDVEGEHFAIRINSSSKTIVIISNVYVTNEITYNQALKAAALWNSKKVSMDGYQVTFQINVVLPTVTTQEVIDQFPHINYYNDDGSLNLSKINDTKANLVKHKATTMAANDNAGNAYFGNEGLDSEFVFGGKYDAGYTRSSRYISMNTHEVEGNMGNYPNIVGHELGHTFGLGDKGKSYYTGDGGIMEYGVPEKWNSVEEMDVFGVLQYAKDYLSNPGSFTKDNAKVIITYCGKIGPNPIDETGGNNNISNKDEISTGSEIQLENQ